MTLFLWSCSTNYIDHLKEKIHSFSLFEKQQFLQQLTNLKSFKLKRVLLKEWELEATCYEPKFLYKGETYLENGDLFKEKTLENLVLVQGDFQQVLNFYQLIKNLNFKNELKEIQILPSESLLVSFHPSLVFFLPMKPSLETLAKMEEIFLNLKKEKILLKTIDLRNSQKVLVKF